jgi:PAS domain S-box-containing protein
VRDRLLGLLTAPSDRFREAATSVPGVRRHDGQVPPLRSFDGEEDGGAPPETERERRFRWMVWVLRDAPLGVSLSGPAYQDTPLVAVNRTFERLTGYPAGTLRGTNPRLLQGPATERDPVWELHASLRGWEPTTVELWNYRADGTRFRNRVSVQPLTDETGVVDHWFGLQGLA